MFVRGGASQNFIHCTSESVKIEGTCPSKRALPLSSRSDEGVDRRRDVMKTCALCSPRVLIWAAARTENRHASGAHTSATAAMAARGGTCISTPLSAHNKTKARREPCSEKLTEKSTPALRKRVMLCEFARGCWIFPLTTDGQFLIARICTLFGVCDSCHRKRSPM